MKKSFFAVLLFASTVTLAQNPLLIKQVNGTNTDPGSNSKVFYKHHLWNGKFFYYTSNNLGLCVTDGTNAGTQNIFTFTVPGGGFLPVISILGPAQDFIYIRYRVNLSASSLQEQIWKSDGTAAGTQLVYSTNSTPTSPMVFSNLASDPSRPASIINNTLFFRNTTATEGAELWKTDGFTTGIVKDINPGTSGSGPVNFGNIGNKVLFYAGNGVVGRELWSTDGTEAGTVLVKDINTDNSEGGTSPNSGSDFLQGETGVCNGKYFFYANTFAVAGAEPWVSDGTGAGTFMLKDIVPGSANSYLVVSQLNNDFLPTDKYMFFRSKNTTTASGNGAALWRSDGTQAGTILLSAADSLSNVSATAATRGNTYLMVYTNGQTGNDSRQYFLMSDGTVAGTKTADSAYFLIGNPVVYKNTGYASGMRGVSAGTTSYDNEIFRTDGTRANTGLAIDLFTGGNFGGGFNIYNSGIPQKFFVIGNYLYFFGRTSASPFFGLYRYDGDFTFNNSLSNSRWRDSANWNSLLPPALTDTANINSGTVLIDGRNANVGVLNLANNVNINLVNTSDSLIVSGKLNTTPANNFTGNGVVVLKPYGDAQLDIANGFAANKLQLAGNAGLLAGNITINNSLNLSSGKFAINNNNITLTGSSSTATVTHGSYIITNGTGSLKIENIGTGARTAGVLFPVGTAANYNPVTILNAGVADVFSARVQPGIYNAYSGETPGGSAYTGGVVNATWFINEGVAGGSDATVTLQWNAAQERAGFDRAQSRVGHYTGSWQLGAPDAAVGSNPYSYSQPGFNSFSPFGIFNNNAALPLRKLFLSVQQTRTANKCSWTVVADDGLSIALERSVDGINFTTIHTTNIIGNGIFEDAVASCFYRLRFTETGGGIKYSNVIRISRDNQQQILVYPTLFKHSFLVQNNINEKAVLRLVSPDGRKVMEQSLTPGTNQIMQALRSGMYLYQILLNGKQISSGHLMKE